MVFEKIISKHLKENGLLSIYNVISAIIRLYID